MNRENVLHAMLLGVTSSKRRRTSIWPPAVKRQNDFVGALAPIVCPFHTLTRECFHSVQSCDCTKPLSRVRRVLGK